MYSRNTPLRSARLLELVADELLASGWSVPDFEGAMSAMSPSVTSMSAVCSAKTVQILEPSLQSLIQDQIRQLQAKIDPKAGAMGAGLHCITSWQLICLNPRRPVRYTTWAKRRSRRSTASSFPASLSWSIPIDRSSWKRLSTLRTKYPKRIDAEYTCTGTQQSSNR